MLADDRGFVYRTLRAMEADGHMATWLARYDAPRRQGGPQACPGVPAAS